MSSVANRKAKLEKEGMLRVKLLGCTVSEKVEQLKEVAEEVKTAGPGGGLVSWLLEAGVELAQTAFTRPEILPGIFAVKTELQACAGSNDYERVVKLVRMPRRRASMAPASG